MKLEIEKHREICLFKSKLSGHEFELRQKEIEEKINFVNISKYKKFLKLSSTKLKDPDDADFFALSLFFNCAIWSNDFHLKQQSLVKVYTTEEIIRKLLGFEI